MFLAIAAAALLGGLALLAGREATTSTVKALQAPAEASNAAALPAPPPNAVSEPSSSAPTPLASARLDGRSLLAKLRELRGSNPTLTLQLAREGNARFGDDADAAERSWFVVKALSELGRHDEARVEGRALVERHQGTRWAEDVYRHLFVNPATHPSERGYGKVLEGD
jgi:hypothetical protein